MNYFKNRNLFIWIIVILLVINISAISTIIFHVYFFKPTQNSEFMSRERPHKFMRKELNLSPEQEIEFSQLKTEFRNNSKEVLELLKENRIIMMKELSETNPDTAKLNQIADEIGFLHTSLKKKTIKHFIGMKNICDSGQFIFLGRMYEYMIMGEDYNVGKDRQFRQKKLKDFKKSKFHKKINY